MSRPDLNLLFTLEVLLAENSVARAARRLQLSPSAMSRALARLREATGDPLLVGQGRTRPRGIPSRTRASGARRMARARRQHGASPCGEIDLQQLDRTFTLRTSEGFVETFGPGILDHVSADAPGVRLRLLPARPGAGFGEYGARARIDGPRPLRRAPL